MLRTSRWIPLLLAGVLALPLSAHGRGPSTPEERSRVLALAADAGRDPLAAMARDGRWFDTWLDGIPDINFGPEAPARWCLSHAQGDLRRVMKFEYELGGVAYQIQHHISNPKTMDEKVAVHQAALESVLRAYESLRDAKPGNRSQEMDEAVAMRNRGELPAFVTRLFQGGR